MKKYKRVVILINLIILLGFFNNSILQNEKLLSEGQLILLEFAPVDPRSLMQGDYMIVRYAISNFIYSDSIPKRGFCVVGLEENGVAETIRIHENNKPIYDNEFLIKYTKRREWGVNIAAESYFFQEGEAYKYRNARYGGIKVDNQGNSLLIGLYDKNRQKIE